MFRCKRAFGFHQIFFIRFRIDEFHHNRDGLIVQIACFAPAIGNRQIGIFVNQCVGDDVQFQLLDGWWNGGRFGTAQENIPIVGFLLSVMRGGVRESAFQEIIGVVDGNFFGGVTQSFSQRIISVNAGFGGIRLGKNKVRNEK